MTDSRDEFAAGHLGGQCISEQLGMLRELVLSQGARCSTNSENIVGKDFDPRLQGDQCLQVSPPKASVQHPRPAMSDERGSKRRRLYVNLPRIPAYIVARPVGVQMLAQCTNAGMRCWTGCGSCGVDGSEMLTAFFHVLSILWGAEAAYQISSVLYYKKIPATLASHAREVCSLCLSTLAKTGQSLKARIAIGLGGCGNAKRTNEAMPEDAWRSNVLFMLKSLEQGIQRLLARSDIAPSVPSPGATWNLSEHMSASEASPSSRVSEVGETPYRDVSSSPALNLFDARGDTNGVAALLDIHCLEDPKSQGTRPSHTHAFDQVLQTLDTSPQDRDSADVAGQRIPPPQSWGQVENAQRLSAIFQTDAASEEYRSACLPPAPGSLSQMASACEQWSSDTPEGQTTRTSWAPQAELHWFARSPCFRLSSAQQAARLQAAHSCVVDPPSQEATYGALLSRLPQELRT